MTSRCHGSRSHQDARASRCDLRRKSRERVVLLPGHRGRSFFRRWGDSGRRAGEDGWRAERIRRGRIPRRRVDRNPGNRAGDVGGQARRASRTRGDSPRGRSKRGVASGPARCRARWGTRRTRGGAAPPPEQERSVTTVTAARQRRQRGNDDRQQQGATGNHRRTSFSLGRGREQARAGSWLRRSPGGGPCRRVAGKRRRFHAVSQLCPHSPSRQMTSTRIKAEPGEDAHAPHKHEKSSGEETPSRYPDCRGGVGWW